MFGIRLYVLSTNSDGTIRITQWPFPVTHVPSPLTHNRPKQLFPTEDLLAARHYMVTIWQWVKYGTVYGFLELQNYPVFRFWNVTKFQKFGRTLRFCLQKKWENYSDWLINWVAETTSFQRKTFTVISYYSFRALQMIYKTLQVPQMHISSITLVYLTPN